MEKMACQTTKMETPIPTCPVTLAESSKVGINIPPPRPKRKPSHPYPRKHNASSEMDNSNDMETEKETPSQLTQPSSTPSYMTAPALQSLGGKYTANLSLGQILESAAAAAALAWSQVVATAGPKVQQQLQVPPQHTELTLQRPELWHGCHGWSMPCDIFVCLVDMKKRMHRAISFWVVL